MSDGPRTAVGKVTGAGPIPADLDDRLVRRDREPLADGALVKFQAIAHGPDPRSNVRWVLHDDGSVRLAYHSRDTDTAVPFDTPLPDEATGRVASATVDDVRSLLEAEAFSELAPYQWRDGEGGASFVVTARVGDDVHEVIYDRASTPLLDRLQRLAAELEDAEDDE